MPINNLSQAQLDPVKADALLLKLKEILNELVPIGKNLTPEERQQFGSINERNKLITTKAYDYHTEQSELQSPDVNWNAFDASWETRSKLTAVESLCKSIIEVASDTRILHDYDLYQMTLTDYDYTKYKAGSTTASGGYTTKHQEMKQFFGATGSRQVKEDPAEDTGEETAAV
jgi:hypothetical protein